jgi:signal transduction histidine kinase
VRRLYLQIYLTVVAIIVVFGLLVGLGWRVFGPSRADQRRMMTGVSNVLERLLPPASAPPADQQAAIEALARDLDVTITLRAPDGALLAHAGDEIPLPRQRSLEPGALHRHEAFTMRLADGRVLLARWGHEPYGALIAIAALAAAIALGAYPVVRRITRRVETLRAQVEALGAGNLAARVEVRGKDEIAGLARSFNRAAERIERLIAAQRGALAAASHELRSPLARIRVAIELLEGPEGDSLRARVARDVAELDALVGEVLLASRLDALEPGQALERREAVDLLGLAAEECARTGAHCTGEPVTVQGDATLLRRLVRNLLENARRHAGEGPVELYVCADPGGVAHLAVSDRGPGVPESERERVFEPFYRPKGASESKDGSFGLGLALVRQIARHHGGEARCLAREGGGTTFEVDLGGGARATPW